MLNIERINIRLPKDIIEKLDKRAEFCGLSRSGYLYWLLLTVFEIYDTDLKIIEKCELYK